jgi:hypothetical protein
MSFVSFDPYNRPSKTVVTAAKVAKPAKVSEARPRSLADPSWTDSTDTPLTAQLDAARRTRDRLPHRGSYHDRTAPSHQDDLERRATPTGQSEDLLDRPSADRLGIVDQQLSLDATPASSLIEICNEYDVGLRLEADGTLVVRSNGRAWRSLVQAIEAHVDVIAQLIEASWDSNDT